ncbi:MAG: ribosome recycling factor, partial [Oscillospiraceae bacterium]|nr:ribosome recycling factor [Oscillospiraceae bacterium]
MKTVFETAKTKMTKTENALKVEYGAIRAGRANPQILDKVTVDYYGTPTPINQLASVAVA